MGEPRPQVDHEDDWTPRKVTLQQLVEIINDEAQGEQAA